MQRLGGAVILMQTSLKKVTNKFGTMDFEEMLSLKSLPVFDENVCEFLNQFSKRALKDREVKAYPDVVAFAFFCRRANIEKLKSQYGTEGNRLGRGMTFHIAPSNVPINFAFSLVAGLLAGNACVVRASSKDFVQTNIVCRLFQETIDAAEDIAIKNIANYIQVVTYGRDNEITAFYSAHCEVRIIWGGDATIANIRSTAIPPRTTEITFADRYSVAILKAESVLNCENFAALAQNFYNDTYLYDQNACSSPRLLYWIGTKEDCAKAQELFWSEMEKEILKKYEISPVIAIDKVMADYKCAIELENVKLVRSESNLVNRIVVDKLFPEIVNYTCPGGSYFEYADTGIDALVGIVTKKFQTVGYYGFEKEELEEFFLTKGMRGVDRVVPIGKTADFTLTWDGYDLIRSMSRVCDIL